LAGTAVVPYVVFRRYGEGLALGYIAALSVLDRLAG
jgi:hypothetical protein